MNTYMSELPDLAGKNVVVMGLGLFGGGVAVTRYLVSHGARVTVTDLKPAEKLAQPLAELEGLPINYELGCHNPDSFRSADLIVVNPAVPRDSVYLETARKAGIPL